MRVSTKGQWLRSAAAVLIVMVMSILSPIGTGLASAQVKLEAIIYNACRIAGDPYAFTGTGYEDLAPSDLVGFGIGFNNAVGKFWGTSLRASQLKFASDDLHFTYRTQDSRTMPQGPILFQWDMVYLSDILNTGSFKLGAPGTCGTATTPPSGSSTTTTLPNGTSNGTSTVSGATTNAKSVATHIFISGKLHDRLSGMTPVGSIHETWKVGRLIKVTAAAAIPSVVPGAPAHTGTVTWALIYSGKRWHGTVRVIDQLEDMVASFAPTTVRWNKTGVVTGTAERGSGKTSSSLSWRV